MHSYFSGIAIDTSSIAAGHGHDARGGDPLFPLGPGGPGRRRAPRRRRRGPQGGYALWLAWLGVAMIGFNTVRVGDYTVSDMIFVAAAGVIVMRLLAGRARDLAPAEARRSPPAMLIGSVLLLTGGTMSSLGAWKPFESMGVVLRIAWLTLVWFWVLRSVCVDRRALNQLLRGWRLTLIITAIAGVLGEMGVQALAATNAENRQTGFFGHPNELGGLLATGLPLLILGLPWKDGESQGTRLVWRLTLIGLLVFSMAATGSITAFLAAILATGVTFGTLALSGRERRRPARRSTPLITIALLGVLAGGVLWLATSDLPIVDRLTRFSEGNSSVNSSVESRDSLNEFVISHSDEVLLVGIGLDKGSLEEAIQNGSESASLQGHASVIHNIHLRVLFESGLPALIGLWILIAVGFRQCRRLITYTRGDEELHHIAVALFASMLATNLFALFQPIFFHRYFWLPVALTSALWALVRTEARQRQLQELVPPAPEPQPLPVLPDNDDTLPPISM